MLGFKDREGLAKSSSRAAPVDNGGAGQDGAGQLTSAARVWKSSSAEGEREKERKAEREGGERKEGGRKRGRKGAVT